MENTLESRGRLGSLSDSTVRGGLRVSTAPCVAAEALESMAPQEAVER